MCSKHDPSHGQQRNYASNQRALREKIRRLIRKYKVVQIWPGLFTLVYKCKQSRSYLNQLLHYAVHWTLDKALWPYFGISSRKEHSQCEKSEQRPWRNTACTYRELECKKIVLIKLSPFYECCFSLGGSPASDFYMPTFRNKLFHLRWQGTYTAYEDGTERGFRNVAYKIQTPSDHPIEKIQNCINF